MEYVCAGILIVLAVKMWWWAIGMEKKLSAILLVLVYDAAVKKYPFADKHDTNTVIDLMNNISVEVVSKKTKER